MFHQNIPGYIVLGGLRSKSILWTFHNQTKTRQSDKKVVCQYVFRKKLKNIKKIKKVKILFLYKIWLLFLSKDSKRGWTRQEMQFLSWLTTTFSNNNDNCVAVLVFGSLWFNGYDGKYLDADSSKINDTNKRPLIKNNIDPHFFPLQNITIIIPTACTYKKSPWCVMNLNPVISSSIIHIISICSFNEVTSFSPQETAMGKSSTKFVVYQDRNSHLLATLYFI